jgi:hypothetical protein
MTLSSGKAARQRPIPLGAIVADRPSFLPGERIATPEFGYHGRLGETHA